MKVKLDRGIQGCIGKRKRGSKKYVYRSDGESNEKEPQK